jgi:hypothetical protein
MFELFYRQTKRGNDVLVSQKLKKQALEKNLLENFKLELSSPVSLSP